MKRDGRLQILLFTCAAIPLLAYGLVRDWEIGQGIAYVWDTGMVDALAHWLAVLALILLTSTAFLLLVTGGRSLMRGALVATAIGCGAGLLSTALAIKRIVQSPGAEPLWVAAAGPEADPNTHLAAAPIIAALGFAVGLVGAIALARASKGVETLA